LFNSTFTMRIFNILNRKIIIMKNHWDNYNNIIPTSTIGTPFPIVVNWNGNNHNAISNKRTYVLVSSLNHMVDKVGIILQAFCGTILVISFNNYGGQKFQTLWLLKSKELWTLWIWKVHKDLYGLSTKTKGSSIKCVLCWK
jgi:hypothetical protein